MAISGKQRSIITEVILGFILLSVIVKILLHVGIILGAVAVCFIIIQLLLR
jgi:hypothetical protein